MSNVAGNKVPEENISQRRKSQGPMGAFGGGNKTGEKAKNFKKSIGKLVKYLRPYLWYIIIALTFTAIATTLSILAPSIVGRLTDEIGLAGLVKYQGGKPVKIEIGGKEVPIPLGIIIDIQKVIPLVITLVVFYLLSMTFHYFQNFIMAGVNQGVSKSLRTRISKKINVVPLKYFDNHAAGDILSRVANDIDTIGQTLNQSVAALFHSVITVIGVMIAMLVTCWQLSLVVMATVPISFILIIIVMKFSQKHFIAQQQNLGVLNGQIEENYSGLNVVKAFNAQEKVKQEFDKYNDKLFKSSKNSSFFSLLSMPMMNFISSLGYVAVCVVGGILFTGGSIGFGVITSFFIYVRLFQNPMTQIAQAAGNLQHTAAAAERVFEFLEENEQEDESNKTLVLKNVKGRVEFKNVKFGYDENKIIIKDFSAKIEPGQKVAIVGPTGAGKTTMINLLMRFYEIKGGEILIDDIPINQLKRENVRSLFGMVLQDTWLFNGTIKENIVYSKENVTDEEIYSACEAANVDHFIKTLPKGYDMVIEDDNSISNGQRQLLTIARAMVQNSPMLILDEATSNVDTRTEQLIQDAMDKVTKGRTSFVIAHRLSTIKNAHLILVMKDGDIIESGTHVELLEKGGFYCDLYNSQFALKSIKVEDTAS